MSTNIVRDFAAQIIPQVVGQIAGELYKSHLPVERHDAPTVNPIVKKAVTRAVNEEIIPRIEHVTNEEPWYQSRVTLGAIASIISAVLLLFGYAVEDTRVLEILVILVPLLSAGGGAFALIGRWFSKKPFLESLRTRNGGA